MWTGSQNSAGSSWEWQEQGPFPDFDLLALWVVEQHLPLVAVKDEIVIPERAEQQKSGFKLSALASP